MKKTLLIIAIFLLLGIILGVLGAAFIILVSPGQYDYSYDIVNNFELIRSSAHDITIIPKDRYSTENEIIPTKVVEVAWNNRYVIAKQYGMKKAYPEEADNTYEIPDETVVNYWILDTENKERYGPFSYEEFSTKLQEFNLTNLQLKPVTEYRKE